MVISGWHVYDVKTIRILFWKWARGAPFPEQFLREMFQRDFPNIKMIRQETDCEKGTPETKAEAIEHVLQVLKYRSPFQSARMLVFMYTRRRNPLYPLHPRRKRKNTLLKFVLTKHFKLN